MGILSDNTIEWQPSGCINNLYDATGIQDLKIIVSSKCMHITLRMKILQDLKG